MPVRRKNLETSGSESNTIILTYRLSLYEIADAYNNVYNWFDVLKKKVIILLATA